MKKVCIILGMLFVIWMVGCSENNVVSELDEGTINNFIEAITNVPNMEITSDTPTPTNTPTPTAISVPESMIVENINALVFSLPDCTDYSASTVWADSEMNIELYCSSALLPKKGLVTAQFAYPNDAKNTNSGLGVELFVGETSNVFFPKNCIMTLTEDEEWNIFSYSMSYELVDEVCKIEIKTHSGAGEKSIPFAITRLIFKDTETGEIGRIELQDPALQWNCVRYASGSPVEYEWVTLQFSVAKVIPTVGPMPTLAPSVDEPTLVPTIPEMPSISERKYITYRLPESENGWHAVWEESEANIVMLYTSEKQLTQGTVYARLYIPKLSGVYRTDAFELAVHAQDDFMNFTSDRIDVEFLGNRISAHNHTWEEKENHYEVLLVVPYRSSQVANGNKLKIVFKSHSDTPYGAYEISFCDVFIVDDSAGEQAVDFSNNSVQVSGMMYADGAPVYFRYTNDLVVPEFYISNMISKLPMGYTYQLEVNAQEGACLRFVSSDPTVATIDDQGKIVTYNAGRCIFTVTNEAGSESKQFVVNVDAPEIVPISYEILMINGSAAKFEFTTEFTMTPGRYQYQSSDEAVVSIGTDGCATAHSAGVSIITVTDTENNVQFVFELEVYAPEDPDGVGKYLSLGHTNLVTVDIAKRSYDLIYAVYRNVFDYFNYGEYEPVVLNFTVGDYSPAYSNMVDIFLASEHMLANAKDVDCITHELIHCAQNYEDVNEYVWLMEGLTDYGRYLFGLHNEDCGWHLADYEPEQHYTNSYTVTANFIKYITENHCSQMPILINEMFKGQAGYQDSIWKENTGYTLDELWDLYANAG